MDSSYDGKPINHWIRTGQGLSVLCDYLLI